MKIMLSITTAALLGTHAAPALACTPCSNKHYDEQKTLFTQCMKENKRAACHDFLLYDSESIPAWTKKVKRHLADTMNVLDAAKKLAEKYTLEAAGKTFLQKVKQDMALTNQERFMFIMKVKNARVLPDLDGRDYSVQNWMEDTELPDDVYNLWKFQLLNK